jgi:hypothetical protein
LLALLPLMPMPALLAKWHLPAAAPATLRVLPP